MRKINIFLAVVAIVFMYACKKSTERNSLQFVDDNKMVQDSLIKMQGLLKLFPESPDGLKRNYDYKNGGLYISRVFIGKEKFIKLENIKAETGFNNKQAKEFLNLSLFLKKNYVPYAYFDESFDYWFFGYREQAQDFDDVRDIILQEESQKSVINTDFKILDNEGMIFLISPKEAKIR